MKKKVITAVLATGATLASIYAFNRLVDYRSDLKKSHLDTIRRKMTWRYGNVSYIKKGSGKPVLLIHDLKPCASSFEWERIINSLSKNHTVYAIDLLGCGLSQKPNLTYTNYLYVQLITDFVKNIIGVKTDIVATGGSGSFAVMATNMNPEYFKKIILVNPLRLEKLAKTTNKTKAIMMRALVAPLFGTLLYNLVFSEHNLKRYMEKSGYSKSHLVSNRNTNPAFVAAHDGQGTGKYLHSSIISNYTNINIAFALKRINNSIYLIMGSDNPDANAIDKEYKLYNPSIESTVIKNTKMLPQQERPEAFIKELNIFLND